MSDGLILHLSGLQAWGGPAQAGVRPTYRQPTRSALTGLIACCAGRERDADNSDLDQLRYTIRTDRPGTLLADFHTVGGNHDPVHGLAAADGGTRDAPIVSTRYYLADAAFTLALTGPTPVIDTAEHALTHPVWTPYLGRRSCLPDTPILLARTATAVDDLDHIPLHRADAADQQILFTYDTPPTPDTPASTQHNDQPIHGRHRAWTPRRIWEQHRTIPAPNGGLGTTWLTTLADHYGRSRPLENAR
ncbi:type I-E CRISPR-associated protein Cas5/CasD [Streptomyces sp. NPDC090077]|uniref:type I-E CRISPR-associated protein Cas5/CasD n=1 Tax=Streptomyces sp. NPDC090077 TaxID=3365938 RepID=UPI0037FA5072